MKRMLIAILALILLTGALPAQDSPKLRNSVTWEKLNRNLAPLPKMGTVIPLHSDIQMKSWWSVGCETLDRDFSNFDRYKMFVGQTGVGYARIQSGWAKCEPEKGVYNFEWLDNIVDGLIAQGVKPWICLCYGNPVYSEDGHDLGARLFGEGPVMDGWVNYVRETVRRYRGKVSMYEVWNEPAGNTPDVYATLFKHTAEAIHQEDPDVKICAFGYWGPKIDYIHPSLEKMRELGCLDLVDYITYHAYYPWPETIKKEVIALQRDVQTFNEKIKLLQGETGCPGQLEYGHAMHSIEWTEYSQVKWDLRQMLTQFGLGIPYSVFTMVDLNYGWMLQSYGLLRMQLNHVPVYKRPKFYAVQNVTSILTYDCRADTTVKAVSSNERSLESYGVRKGKKLIGAVLWYGDKQPSDVLVRDLVDVTINGLELKNPVYVDMITGTVHDLSKTLADAGTVKGMSFKQLPVWDSPIMIINRDAFYWSKTEK